MTDILKISKTHTMFNQICEKTGYKIDTPNIAFCVYTNDGSGLYREIIFNNDYIPRPISRLINPIILREFIQKLGEYLSNYGNKNKLEIYKIIAEKKIQWVTEKELNDILYIHVKNIYEHLKQ